MAATDADLIRRYHEQGRLETAARGRLGMPIRSYELETEELEQRLDASALRAELAVRGRNAHAGAT